jgi:hypothetical protein
MPGPYCCTVDEWLTAGGAARGVFCQIVEDKLDRTALFRSGAVYGTATPRELLNKVFKRSVK